MLAATVRERSGWLRKRLGRAARIAATIVLVAGCAVAGPGDGAVRWPPSEDEPRKWVWLVSHGWHTRVAVRRADIAPGQWPELRDLGETAYVEVGWGDRDFYPNPEPSIWDALDTIVRATPAALHVGGFDPSPPEFLPGLAIVRIPVTAEGFDGLVRFLREHYSRDAAGEAIRIGPGFYARSWFYEATGRYHALSNNSNTWTARALRVAGVPMEPAQAPTAGAVMAQASEFGAQVGRE